MDDDIYAYEQEMDGMDEWEEMHEHEIEAAEEEMRAMEAAEAAAQSEAHAQAGGPPRQPLPIATTPPPQQNHPVSVHGDALEQAHARVHAVLERCAAALGEDDDEEMELATESASGPLLREDAVARKSTHRHQPMAVAIDSVSASYLYSRPPVDVDSMSIVLPTGERRFLRKRSDASVSSTTTPVGAISQSLIPITALVEAIEQRQIEVAANASSIAAATANEVVLTTPPSKAKQAMTTSESANNTLWLDKYKPQRFIDLLSDERTNREVLSWIKTWDAFVFPGKPKVAAPAISGWEDMPAPGGRAQGKNAYGGGNGGGDGGGSGGKGSNASAVSEDPNDPRPRDKIILLCGPPGAGKTTLANIVARHAGYNPIEVNASDDRTAGVLKNKIISAMEMQSIFGDRKPNCLILDEIDGAMNGGDGKSAIAVIQEIVSAPLHSAQDGKRSSGRGTRNSSHHPLSRPLICICNDQFASVLRPLRKLAKIFVLDTPSPPRLISRLKFICRTEGLRTTTGALAALCANGGNDIRFSVNALQFQSTQTKHITTAVVAAGIVGRKDHQRSIFETMDMVFYRAKSAKSASEVRSTQQLEEAAHSLGNFPLLINALDENLPRLIFNDPTMNKICDAFEWMGIADSWDRKVHAEQQFAFLAYLPFAARAVRLACCTSSRRRIEYPRSHGEAYKKREQSCNILRALTENSLLQPCMRHSADVLVVDVVPWLLATLSPPIRHINPSLQTADEKTAIQRLIDLMASLGLSFRPKFSPNGAEDYALEPAINELVVFRNGENGGLASSSSDTMLPMSVRKMVMREIELEQMRRNERQHGASSSMRRKTQAEKQTSTPAAAKPSRPESKKFKLPELSEQELAEKLEITRKRNPFAFAHREAKRKRDAAFQEQKQQQQQQERDGEEGENASKRLGVRYRYNEGYTSGIKTTVYMRDLLIGNL